MKRLIKTPYLIIILMLAVASCELYDNIDTKHSSVVSPESLFTNAQVAMVNQLNNSSVNYNISRLLAQYWSEVTYTSESRYDFVSRNIPDNYWNTMYRAILMDFKESRELLSAQDIDGTLAAIRDNKLLIIDIMEVYVYHTLVDAFGNVPYSEALLGAEKSDPVYDDATTIYADLIARLTADIAGLDNAFSSFGETDILYGGDIDSWKIFASSLKLRMGMRLADVDNAAAQAAVQAAYSEGVFGAGEGAFFEYAGVTPHVNTIYNSFIVANRKDWVPSNTLIDYMVGLTDPRLPLLFTLLDTNTVDPQEPPVYVGLEYGSYAGGPYNSQSHFTAMFFEPAFEVVLMDYAEVEFLFAEAVERGYSVGGATAEAHYNNGVTASIEYWGGTSGDATAYLGQANVAYTTAGATWRETIGMQKWLALYNRGVEGWAEWRRLDYPQLNIPEDLTYADIPLRMPYPFREDKLNKDNYVAASSAIGGDLVSTSLFWDVIPTPFE
ncbi:MAG: SusD/RagB family nutrient-binding outer membrane lipoprotein [Bacteroidales bacterium]|nr:SusD/RagB family nutrient-binding outer membrane lipoprotein [Bacteroidales bacterium]